MGLFNTIILYLVIHQKSKRSTTLNWNTLICVEYLSNDVRGWWLTELPDPGKEQTNQIRRGLIS